MPEQPNENTLKLVEAVERHMSLEEQAKNLKLAQEVAKRGKPAKHRTIYWSAADLEMIRVLKQRYNIKQEADLVRLGLVALLTRQIPPIPDLPEES